MIRHSTGSFAGLHNTTIFTQQWTPSNPPRAILIVVHGYAEHSGRYDHLARFFAEKGYAVYALDLRGHGYSGGKPVAVNAFDDYVQDVKIYFDFISKKFPGLPVVLYGHSMGSLVSLLFTLKWQDSLAALVTTGTALHPSGDFPFAGTILGFVSRIAPDARLIPELDASQISHDPAVVEAYKNDPKVHTGPIRLRTGTELVRAAHRVASRLSELRLPYLAVHGGADALCAPTGAEVIRNKAPEATTTVKIYNNLYHEVHNEPEKDAVLNDIADWLEQHIPAGSS